MNAHEARELSKKSSDLDSFKNDIKEVDNQIEEAAKKGLFSIRTEHTHPLIQAYFKGNGYDVKHTGKFYNSIVRVHIPASLSISW